MLVQNKGKYVRHAEGVMLVPGSNDVSEQDWKKFSNHKIIKSLIDKGEIVTHKVKSTTDMNANQAIELVEDTFSVDLLEQWKANDDRKTVLDAIEEQLKEIKGEGENGEDDE